jgi:GNAT superfamily N-acetyltransferase
MLTISIKGDGIELENLAIYPEHQGKGYGTALMGVFFSLLIDTFDVDFPPIHLSCIGCATLGPQYYTNEVSKQCAFFRKFGFRVSKYHKTGKPMKIVKGTLQRLSDHAEMEFNIETWYKDYYEPLNILE